MAYLNLTLGEQDFRANVEAIVKAASEGAAHVTDDQFTMRLVTNAELVLDSIAQLDVAIERGTRWSALEVAVRVGILLGIGQTLPEVYHAGRRTSE